MSNKARRVALQPAVCSTLCTAAVAVFILYHTYNTYMRAVRAGWQGFLAVFLVYFLFFVFFHVFLLLFPHGVLALFIGYRSRYHATNAILLLFCIIYSPLCSSCGSYRPPATLPPLLFVYVRSCTYNSESITRYVAAVVVVNIYFLCASYEAFSFSPSVNVRHELQRRSLLRKH